MTHEDPDPRPTFDARPIQPDVAGFPGTPGTPTPPTPPASIVSKSPINRV